MSCFVSPAFLEKLELDTNRRFQAKTSLSAFLHKSDRATLKLHFVWPTGMGALKHSCFRRGHSLSNALQSPPLPIVSDLLSLHSWLLRASSVCLENNNLSDLALTLETELCLLFLKLHFSVRFCHRELVRVRVLGLRLQQRGNPCWGSSGKR